MRKLPLSEVTPGNELAVEVKIQSEHPGTLYRFRLEEGHSLTRRDVGRLEGLGHQHVFIKDPATDDLDQYIHDEEVARAEEEVSRNLSTTIAALKKDSPDDINPGSLTDSVRELKESLQGSPAMMAFTSLKSHDDYTAKHSLDVSKLALGFVLANEEKLLRLAHRNTAASGSFVLKHWTEDLGIGALLHDIGKWKIPEYILTKPDELSQGEWEAMQKHPKLGTKILRKLPRGTFRPLVRQAILTHHEKYGGNGYPRGLSSDDIHLHGRITALCDVYSALTSNRPYRDGMSPARALETLNSMQEDDQHFDPKIHGMFKEYITPYPIGQDVVLSDDSRGVVYSHEDGADKPYVRILYKDQERLETPVEIQANTETGPEIVS